RAERELRRARKQLERDLAVELEIARLDDDAHRAAAELATDRVARERIARRARIARGVGETLERGGVEPRIARAHGVRSWSNHASSSASARSPSTVRPTIWISASR